MEEAVQKAERESGKGVKNVPSVIDLYLGMNYNRLDYEVSGTLYR